MKFGKTKTDGERLADAIRKLEAMRNSYINDPWSFIGAIMTEYHAIHVAATAGGEIESLKEFEARIAGSMTSGARTSLEPYS